MSRCAHKRKPRFASVRFNSFRVSGPKDENINKPPGFKIRYTSARASVNSLHAEKKGKSRFEYTISTEAGAKGSAARSPQTLNCLAVQGKPKPTLGRLVASRDSEKSKPMSCGFDGNLFFRLWDPKPETSITLGSRRRISSRASRRLATSS